MVLHSSTLTPEEKHDTIAYMANNPTPAAQGTMGQIKIINQAAQADKGRDFQLNEAGRGHLQKIEEKYNAAKTSAEGLEDMVNLAKQGNKVAASFSPTEGTLAIVTSQGVKRINRTEVEGIEGAGSIFDRIAGKLGKAGAGQPLDADLQNDLIQLSHMLKGSAYKEYLANQQGVTRRYKLDDEKPLPDPNVSASGTANSGSAPPAGASHEVYAADGKTLLGWNVNNKFVKAGSR